MTIMASGKDTSCFFMTVAEYPLVLYPVQPVDVYMTLDLLYAASAATPPPTSDTNTSSPSHRAPSMASHTGPKIGSKSPSASFSMVKIVASRSVAFLKPSRCKSAWGSLEMQMTSVIPLLWALSFSVSLGGSQHQSVRFDRRGRSTPDMTNNLVSLLPFCRRRICEYAFQHFTHN